jgi:hypothetical protein
MSRPDGVTITVLNYLKSKRLASAEGATDEVLHCSWVLPSWYRNIAEYLGKSRQCQVLPGSGKAQWLLPFL